MPSPATKRYTVHRTGATLDLTSRAAAIIAAVLPELDEYSREADRRWRYVGPILPPVPDTPATLPWPPDDPRPLVLVSLTTGRAWGPQRQRLQRILDALTDLSLRVLATTGPFVQPGELRSPGNMHIVPYVPHRRVMPLATVCVTHGGHATLAEALAHGVPMVLLPNPMSDQLYLANRVATSGAAVVVDQDAIGAEIREAVVKVLSDKTYVRAAAALSGRCNADSAARAADAVEAAAIERAPVR